MWVNDGKPEPAGAKGRPKRRQSGFHAWPGEGLFPAKRMKGNGWTVYPDSPAPPTEKLEIRMFELARRLERPLPASATPEDAQPVSIAYKNVMKSPSAWANGTIVFEPEIKPQAGKMYWVSLQAGSFRIAYCVEFVADEI